MHFHHVFVAGTFDGLHKGHRFLLSQAFQKGEKVTIGLTSDEFVKKFKVQSAKFKIKTQKERKKQLRRWVGDRWNVNIIFIDDPYEPAASATDVDALVVTAETRKRGEEINRKRKERGLKPLVLVGAPLVAAADGKPISSTRMRNGEIDRHGRLVMPESLRPLLQKPLGRVCSGKAIDEAIRASKGKLVIAVGDVTTKTFLDAGRVPNVSIIDLRVGRQTYFAGAALLSQLRKQLRKVVPCEAGEAKVKSGPGFISSDAIDAIRQGQPVIVVDGEEDLLTLPAIVHAPVGAIVYYGQPGKGMVEVPVNKATKQTARGLLRSFLLKAKEPHDRFFFVAAVAP